MTEETGAAPEAAEPIVTPEPDAGPMTADDAIDRALDEVYGEERPDRPRDELGRFTAKEELPEEPAVAEPAVVAEPAPPAEPVVEAPDWLNDKTAKEEWAKAPPAVRDSVARRFAEMERGIAQYREQVEPLKPFFDLAKQHNTTVADALRNYTALEAELAKNPVQGLEAICRNLGTDLRTIAAKVLGQEPPKRDDVVEGLRTEIAQLKQGLGGVQQTFQQQRSAETTRYVEQFFAQHPRADELSKADLAFNIPDLIKRGYALEQAYEIADRMNPAAQPVAPAASPATARTGANPKATLSIAGAPTAGSNPASVPKSTSVGSSIDYAFSKLGIGG